MATMKRWTPFTTIMTKLWVMFFTSLLLVSAMNFYAVVREPDMIEIDEIRNFPRETVKIEGVLTGYVRDPYGEGADRIDRQVQEINGHIKIIELLQIRVKFRKFSVEISRNFAKSAVSFENPKKYFKKSPTFARKWCEGARNLKNLERCKGKYAEIENS